MDISSSEVEDAPVNDKPNVNQIITDLEREAKSGLGNDTIEVTRQSISGSEDDINAWESEDDDKNDEAGERPMTTIEEVDESSSTNRSNLLEAM